MPAITGGNSLDVLQGVLAQLDIADWVTAGGAGTFNKPGGYLDGLVVDESFDTGLVEPDNNLYPISAYPGRRKLVIKGEFVEASLRKKALALGGATADVNVITQVATLPIKQLSAMTYYQVRLIVAGQAMVPAHTEFPTDIYTKRTLTLWRCLFTKGPSQTYKGAVKCPFEITVFYDTSVTESATVGAIGKEVDSVV
jgi:hypothetical protein